MYEKIIERLQDFAAGTRKDDDAQLAFDAIDALASADHREWIMKAEIEGLHGVIPRWFSVEECLPSEGSYLIFDGEDVREAYYGCFCGKFEWVDPFEQCAEYEAKYWMEMPTPPIMDAEAEKGREE